MYYIFRDVVTEPTTFITFTISTMENTMMVENEVPDEFTALLPQGNKFLGAPEQQIAEDIFERNPNSGNSFEPQKSPATTPTELGINRSDRSWTGIPRWLGRIALLALFLGFVTNVPRIETLNSADTRCSISTVNLDNSFILTAYLKIGKVGIGRSQEIENTHYDQARIWVTNKVLLGCYKHFKLESLCPVHL